MLLNGEETARLRFRNVSIHDLEAWMEFVTDPLAVKYFGETVDPYEFCKGWIERQLGRYEKQGYGLYALIDKDSNAFVGQCGLLLQEAEGKNYLEIGYHLFPRYWKKGYATEAARFCRDFGFENNMEETIVSLIHPDNLNSQAVARRNGMKPWRSVLWRDAPHLIFSITRTEWSQVKNKV